MDCRKCRHFREGSGTRYYGECHKRHEIFGVRRHCINRECTAFEWAQNRYKHDNCSNCRFCVNINKGMVAAVCAKKARVFRANSRRDDTKLNTCDDYKERHKLPPKIDRHYFNDNSGEWIELWYCPKCDCSLPYQFGICPDCGQRLDWSSDD